MPSPSANTAHLVCQLSYLQQFPSYSNHNCKKNRQFYVPRPSFLFALGTPLRQSRKTLHEWKDNSVLAKPLAAYTHLSSTVSQLFEPQVQIGLIAVFTYRSPHFRFSWRCPCDYQQNVAWMERQFNACQTPRSMYPCIFNSSPVIRTASAKNCRFHVPQPTFLFPWRRPCDYHPICSMDGKTIQCLPNPSQHVPIYLQ